MEAQIEHLLSTTRKDNGRRLTYTTSQVWAHTQPNRDKGVSLLQRGLCFSGGLREDGWEEASLCIQFFPWGKRIVGLWFFFFFPASSKLFFPTWCSGLVSGLKLQVQEAGIVPEQENITVPLTFMWQFQWAWQGRLYLLFIWQKWG
jgi:hypothetical protein